MASHDMYMCHVIQPYISTLPNALPTVIEHHHRHHTYTDEIMIIMHKLGDTHVDMNTATLLNDGCWEHIRDVVRR